MGCCEQRDQRLSNQLELKKFVTPIIEELIVEGSLDLPFSSMDVK